MLSALILVAALAFGRQVLDWWAADEEGPLEPAAQLAMTEGLGDPARTHQLQFGDAPWAVVRKTVVGTRDEAADRLRATCRELVSAGCLPEGDADASERRLLASLAGREPVAEAPGRWGLYELEGGLPMVVGVSRRSGTRPPRAGEGLAERSTRVVAWGLAVPSPERTWTLYAFHPTSSGTNRPADPFDVPLPPDCTKILSMRAAGGAGLVALRGPRGGPRTKAFDRCFREHGWTPDGGWTRSGSTWHSRQRRSVGGRTQTIEVALALDPRGRLSGLVMIAPVTPVDPKRREGED